MKNKKDKKKQHGTISNTVFAIKWFFKISPAYAIYKFLSIVLGDIIVLFEHTYLAAYIVSCVEKHRPLTDILWFFIPLVIAVTLKVTLNPLVDAYISPRFNAKFKKAVDLTLYNKAVGMEISKYDNSEFYNDFVWAMQQAPSHIYDLFLTFSQMISKIAVVLIAGTYIVVVDPVVLIAAAIIIPVCVLAFWFANKLYIKKEEELVPIRRKRDYVNRVFYLVDFIKDIKQSKISEKLEKDFEDSSKAMEEPIKRYGIKIGGLHMLNGTFQSFIWDGAFLIYLFYQAIINLKFSLGNLLGVYNSGNRLIRDLRQMARIFPQFQKHSLHIEKMRTFLETENKMQDNGTAEIKGSGDIILDNVTFTYEGNEKPTIKNLSLNIKKGEKIALVGFNGAGKTTLIKLILRLYDLDSGSISYAGKNIKEYPIKKYRENYGVLFQDFEIIAADISQNINMSTDEFDQKRADKVLQKVGFTEKLRSLKNGYQTQLTKEFYEDGVNLSGGEAQKIALARVLYSGADVIILDEPSSALDPIAEYQLNKAVTDLNKEKTVIIISHRLSTTRFVDKIYMFENGEIIENGSHEELLKKKGKYAEMFDLQAEKYRL